MKIINKIAQNYLSLLKIGLIDPGLLRYVWQLKHKGLTYLGYQRLYSLIQNYFLVRQSVTVEPSVAEFGVGWGGSAAILAWLVGNYGGNLLLFDIFSRIPPPSSADGEEAEKRYMDILHHEDNHRYYGNQSDLLELVRKECLKHCQSEQLMLIPGKYEESLSSRIDVTFNLVHIDCDWYESVRTVLRYIEPRVVPKAIVQIDDYLFWEGTRKAVDESKWVCNFRQKIIDGALVVFT